MRRTAAVMQRAVSEFACRGPRVRLIGRQPSAGGNPMKAVLAPILFALLSGGAVFAAPPQPSIEPGAVNAIKQLEQEMGDAMIRVDLAKLREVYADDFVAFGGAGKVITK